MSVMAMIKQADKSTNQSTVWRDKTKKKVSHALEMCFHQLKHIIFLYFSASAL